MSRALGLYLHFPFCAYKCGYCDFNSWVEKDMGLSPHLDTEPQRQWVEGIKNEIRFWTRHSDRALSGFSIDTLFMGGGTPSLLRPELWRELVAFLKSELNFSPELEWTVEANPETVSEELLAQFAELGVNRISLGIQSFEEKYLRRLERGATPDGNRRALGLLKKRWPHRWSLDLMFGLPAQSLEEWQADLRQALEFDPSHVSAYQLTLTTEKSKKWMQGTDAELLEFFQRTRDFLGERGLAAYEISNFARPGHESRHNLKYWRAEPFLGLGPGAYSLLPAQLSSSPWGAHLKNPSRLPDWLKWSREPELNRAEIRTEAMHVAELLLVGLRLEAGIAKSTFPAQTPWSRLEPLSHLLELSERNLRATPRGREILDTTVLEALRCLQTK